ncbi:MAG: ROK family protein [Acidobacteria bacterium]|nr:ROK family protein [Acidobacteriota bacterium]
MRFGVDVGGTKIALGLVTPDGRLAAGSSFSTPSEGTAEQILEAVADGLPPLLQEAGDGLEAVQAVGMGFPAKLEEGTGKVLTAPNVPGFIGCILLPCFEDALRRRTGYRGPVAVANDTQVAALAEARWGAGRGCPRFLYLTVSTGVGGAVFDRGTEGGSTVNLEPGLSIFPDPDAPERCLEELAGGACLARRVREELEAELLEHGPEGVARRTSLLGPAPLAPSELRRRLDAVGVVDLARAAEEGDPYSRSLLDTSADHVAAALAQLVLAADRQGRPLQRIVVGGSIALKTKGYLARIRATLENRLRHSPAAFSADRDLVEAGLGDERGVLGAALLPVGPRRPLGRDPA